jgi:hypothetical protein
MDKFIFQTGLCLISVCMLLDKIAQCGVMKIPVFSMSNVYTHYYTSLNTVLGFISAYNWSTFLY